MKKINYIIEKSYKKDCLEKKDLKAFGEHCDDRDEEDMRQVENTFHAILKSNRYLTAFLYILFDVILSPMEVHKKTHFWKKGYLVFKTTLVSSSKLFSSQFLILCKVAIVTNSILLYFILVFAFIYIHNWHYNHNL